MFTRDLQTDFALFDGGQTVSLLQRRAGTADSVTVRNATTGPLVARQFAALGELEITGAERSWSLNAADVGPAGVQPGDLIDDGVSRWLILQASQATLGARWRCITRQQASSG